MAKLLHSSSDNATQRAASDAGILRAGATLVSWTRGPGAQSPSQASPTIISDLYLEMPRRSAIQNIPFAAMPEHGACPCRAARKNHYSASSQTRCDPAGALVPGCPEPVTLRARRRNWASLSLLSNVSLSPGKTSSKRALSSTNICA
jgi:hypothetical protein